MITVFMGCCSLYTFYNNKTIFVPKIGETNTSYCLLKVITFIFIFIVHKHLCISRITEYDIINPCLMF